MGLFIPHGNDNFNPEYGEINWKRRLNQRLEEAGVELNSIAYVEQGKEPMQVTQENTHIYINQIADELDCIVVHYDADADKDVWTWYFRHKFESDELFHEIVTKVGVWATVFQTLYPKEHVVQCYEQLMDGEIPDYLPDEI